MRRITMRSMIAAILLIGTVQPMTWAQENKNPIFPPTKKDNVVEVLHGVKLVDPYRWLEDGKSKDVQAWVEEQNKLTQSILGNVPGRDKIRARLSSLLE